MQERTVLFVDDDEILLQLLEMKLRDEVYCKHFARSGTEALDILHREEVNVMVVDMVMPMMGGLELLRIVKREYPNIVSMVLSAYAQPPDVMTAMFEQGICRYIAKPWKFDGDFVAVIRDVVENYDLLRKRESIAAESRQCSERSGIAE